MATKATEEFRETPDLLEQRAFELFSQRSARGASPSLVKQCFRDASMFLAEAAKIGDGSELKNEPESVLADVSAPNLPHAKQNMHPLNLVSRRFGDPTALLKAQQYLDKYPDNDETEPAYAELGWDRKTTNLARAILPPYAKALATVGSN